MFNLKKVIREALTTEADDAGEVFARIEAAVEAYHGREVRTLHALRARDNAKLKGDVWEEFCALYLQYLPRSSRNATRRYEAVWRWQEVPAEVLGELGLVNRRGRRMTVDNGIDIIAKRLSSTRPKYDAIQCKYLGNSSRLVSWAALSTFVGLTRATGPWTKCLVMTNARGVTYRIPRLPQDGSYCQGTFRNTPRTYWMQMIGEYVEHQLSMGIPVDIERGCTPPHERASSTQGLRDGIPYTERDCIPSRDRIPLTENGAPRVEVLPLPTSPEELRQRRLAHFARQKDEDAPTENVEHPNPL